MFVAGLYRVMSYSTSTGRTVRGAESAWKKIYSKRERDKETNANLR